MHAMLIVLRTNSSRSWHTPCKKGGKVEIDFDMALEDAIQKMKNEPSKPATVMQNGKAVGALEMRALLDAIERPAPESASGTVYR